MIKALLLILVSGFFSLGAEQIIHIVRDNNDWRPLEWEADGEFYGFHIDLIRSASELAGFEPRFQSVPWPRALYMMETGAANGISYVSYSEERAQYLYYDERNILTTVQYIVVAGKGHDLGYKGDLKSLSGRRVGIIHGYFYGSAFGEAREMIDILEGRNMEQLYENLMRGRIDAFLTTVEDFDHFLNTAESASDHTVLDSYQNDKVYIAFSKANFSLDDFEKFSSAMAEFKETETYENLLRRYERE